MAGPTNLSGLHQRSYHLESFTARKIASAGAGYIYCIMLRICQFLFPFAAMLAQIVTLDDDKTFQR